MAVWHAVGTLPADGFGEIPGMSRGYNAGPNPGAMYGGGGGAPAGGFPFNWAGGGGGVGLYGPTTKGAAGDASLSPNGKGGSDGIDASQWNGGLYGGGGGGQLVAQSPSPKGGRGACRVFYGPNQRGDLGGFTLLVPPITWVTGEQVFDQPGTFTWTAPAGVVDVNVLCVGGGGGAGSYDPSTGQGSASGGGGERWHQQGSCT
jgi:hypothetical protein